MADLSSGSDVGGLNKPGDAVLLPEADPALQPPPGGDVPMVERLYFDPERWDAEVVNHLEAKDEDPVATDRGRVEGQGTAALFLSDFHIADETAGGDDFLESHLHAQEQFGGLYTGFFPPGESRAGLFASVLTFAQQRVRLRAGVNASLDVVLNGDVLNILDLKGRGGTFVGQRHAPFFRALAGMQGRATVFWLRGNHDYVVPSGPWRRGEFYVNRVLQTLAEHGDYWDKENWPPGPNNEGSRFVIEACSTFEVHASVMKDGTITYLMSGLDNMRPMNDATIKGFLDRRSKYSDVAALAAVLARFKSIGTADDSAALDGAQRRRKREPYRDWLMIQGHTHVPAMVPGVYYNLGTWISTLVAPEGKETQIEAFPFLLVYLDADGRRVDEYYVVRRERAGMTPRVTLQSAPLVNELRREFGYEPMGE